MWFSQSSLRQRLECIVNGQKKGIESAHGLLALVGDAVFHKGELELGPVVAEKDDPAGELLFPLLGWCADLGMRERAHLVTVATRG